MSDTLTVLDMDGALERVDGDLDLFKELLEIFFDMYAEQIDQLHQAIDTSDPKGMLTVAHSIKGAAGNVGAKAASEWARQIEAMGHEEQIFGAGDKVQALDNAVTQLRDHCLSKGLLDENS